MVCSTKETEIALLLLPKKTRLLSLRLTKKAPALFKDKKHPKGGLSHNRSPAALQLPVR